MIVCPCQSGNVFALVDCASMKHCVVLKSGVLHWQWIAPCVACMSDVTVVPRHQDQ